MLGAASTSLIDEFCEDSAVGPQCLAAISNERLDVKSVIENGDVMRLCYGLR